MKISKVFVGSFLAGYLLLGVCNVLLTAGLFSIAAAFGAHVAACMRGAPRGKGKKVLPKAGAEESRGLAG